MTTYDVGDASLHVFATEAGEVCSKSDMVTTLDCVAKKLELDVVDSDLKAGSFVAGTH